MSIAPPSSSPSPPAQSPTIDETLFPGLPNDVGTLILSFVSYPDIPRLKSTCKSWRRALTSLRHGDRRRLTSLVCVFPQDPSVASPFLLDPTSLAWLPLPPAPCDPNLYGLCNFSAIPSHSGPHLYLLGGSLFDARSFPLDRPSPSSAALRFDFAASRWDPLSPMLSPRGSFASAAVSPGDSILVAGGGSRHALFAAAGSRTSSAERYDAARDEWAAVEGMPEFRAGCVGFVAGPPEEKEFWVMGGYGESRTISGVFPVDELCRDVVAMGLDSGKWREVGDMWGEGETVRPGKIVVVDQEDLGVFMLDGTDILRYNMSSNRWSKESRVPKEAPLNSSFGFVVSDGELFVITNHEKFVEPTTDIWRPRKVKKKTKLYLQIYNPKSKTWRSRVTKSPFDSFMDFNTTVMCNVRL